MVDFSREINLIGQENFDKLAKAKVAVVGVGGVGGYCVEALVRMGVGEIRIFDGDTISSSNVNRQIIATTKNIGNSKVEEFKDRCQNINPNCKVIAENVFVNKDNVSLLKFEEIDFVIDAIDNITAKIALIKYCQDSGVEIISCMGTGNKLDPTRFEVTDIYKTSVCPVAKIIRKLCRENEIKQLKVVYSKEEPIINCEGRVPSSISFVPPVAGLILVSEAYKYLIKK